MAYAFVQQKEHSENRGAESQASCSAGAFGTSLTAGNTLVCVVWIQNVAGDPTVTLTGPSATWVEEAEVVNGDVVMHSFYALNITGGETTAVVANFSGSGLNVKYPSIAVAEYSGLKTSAARLAFIGQHQASPGSGSDDVTSGLLGTLSAQPAAIIAFTTNENSDGLPAAGTSFTGRAACWDYEGTATKSSRFEDRRVTATTSVAGTFARGSASPHKTIAWAFEEVTSGGSIVPQAMANYRMRTA